MYSSPKSVVDFFGLYKNTPSGMFLYNSFRTPIAALNELKFFGFVEVHAFGVNFHKPFRTAILSLVCIV